MANYKSTPSLGFGESLKLAFGRLTDFSGRSRRSEFWYFMVLVVLVQLVVNMFLGSSPVVAAVVDIIIIGLGLSVTVRRLQDTGKSALFVYVSYALGIASNLYTALSGIQEEMMSLVGDPDGLMRLMEKESATFMAMGTLSLLFMVSSLIVFIFCLLDSTPGPNKYGESPKYIAE